MRVSNSMMVRSTLSDIGNNLERLQRSQTQVSTGKAFTRSSDNPDSATSAMSTRKELRQLTQRERLIDDAKLWVGAADTQLTSALGSMNRARDIAISAVNPSTLSTSSARSALAAEVRSLRSELLGIANAQLTGRPLFAGTANAPAYDASGTYLGNDGAVVRDVSTSSAMTVNVPGPQVFGDDAAPGGNVFAVLDRIATAIETADINAIATEQALFDTRFTTLRDAVATVGVNSANLDQLMERAGVDRLRLEERLSKLEDVNLVDALVQVKTDETAYQASLQVVSKILPMSLLDYMR